MGYVTDENDNLIAGKCKPNASVGGQTADPNRQSRGGRWGEGHSETHSQRLTQIAVDATS